MRPDPRIDAHIENAPAFAKPILTFLRETIHETCPEVEEAWKWSYPHFMYNGKILCAFMAFKQHCGFGFWLQSEMKSIPREEIGERSGMFTFGKLKSTEDLPPKTQLKTAIREAMELIDLGVTLRKAPAAKELEVPPVLAEALKSNPAAKKVFDAGSPSFRKEYILWINDAKTGATRNKRLDQTLEWLAEGKARNWKYMKK